MSYLGDIKITMIPCNHRIKQFYPLDEGYRIICLKCGEVVREEHGLSKALIALSRLFFNLAIGSIALDMAVESLKESGILDEKKEGEKDEHP